MGRRLLWRMQMNRSDTDEFDIGKSEERKREKELKGRN